MKILVLLFISFTLSAQSISDLSIQLKTSIDNLQKQFDIINAIVDKDKQILAAFKNCQCDDMFWAELAKGHTLVGLITMDPNQAPELADIVTVLPYGLRKIP